MNLREKQVILTNFDYPVGQNFRRTKLFVGYHFRHFSKNLSLSPDKVVCNHYENSRAKNQPSIPTLFRLTRFTKCCSVIYLENWEDHYFFQFWFFFQRNSSQARSKWSEEGLAMEFKEAMRAHAIYGYPKFLFKKQHKGQMVSLYVLILYWSLGKVYQRRLIFRGLNWPDIVYF